MVVTVTDRGPGIPQADLNRVFEKFYRGPQARERVPGTGMGLAIAREIVRGHGGELKVVSRLRPRQRVLVYLAAGGAGDALMSLRILVVDDEPQIRRVMRSALTGQGYSVAEARSGEEASGEAAGGAAGSGAAGRESAGHERAGGVPRPPGHLRRARDHAHRAQQ